MEQDVGLLSTNRHVRGSSFGNWIRRRGDILILFVFGDVLFMIGFDGLGGSVCAIPRITIRAHRFLSQVGIGDIQLHHQQNFQHKEQQHTDGDFTASIDCSP